MPFSIERNDLCSVEADAIVVAANKRLQITGGVGLTVARVAGLEELQEACDKIGHCPCGSAVATPAFNLRQRSSSMPWVRFGTAAARARQRS